MRYLTLLSHGRENEYRRALWAMYSFFAHLQNWEGYRVVVHTDRPDWFEPWLKAFPVEYRPLTQERIRELKRDIQFIHLLKITLVRELLEAVQSDLLFVDSDTFFRSSAEPIFDWVGPGQAVLQKREYTFAAMLTDKRLPPDHRLWGEFLRDQALKLSDGSLKKVDLSLSSWNAGAIGLSPTMLDLFDDVDAMAVEIFKGTGSHVSEQYAYSIQLGEKTRLRDCEASLFHYHQVYEKLTMDAYLSDLFSREWLMQGWEVKKKDVLQRCTALPGLIPVHPARLKWESLHAFGQKSYRTGFQFALRYLRSGGWRDIRFWRDLLYVVRQIFGRLFGKLQP